MMEWYFAAGLVVLAAILGFVLGALFVRNNYSHFKKDEKALRDLVLDTKLSAEQKLLHIRNHWKV